MRPVNAKLLGPERLQNRISHIEMGNWGTRNNNTRGSIYDTSITRIVRYSAIYFLSHPINDHLDPSSILNAPSCMHHSLEEWQ
jgi:hypothetical protein